ncbi:1678_t:CDS:2 [Entrophospora sp. SA101]|nr:1678_t:CDS:2 [Entrophospora sp. SA101]
MLLEVIQIIIVTSSFIIILLKFNKQSSDYDFLDESGDTFNDEESTRLSQDAMFTFYWFYSTIISIIALKASSRKLRWVINIILTIIFTVATMLSLLQMRRIFLIESNDAEHTKIQISIAVCNLILSILLTSISITTPRGPKLMHGERPVSGIVYCSIWDFLTFSMISPLINKASKGPLKDSDLEELPFANRALSLYNMDVGRISEFATWWSTGCIDSPIESIASETGEKSFYKKGKIKDHEIKLPSMHLRSKHTWSSITTPTIINNQAALDNILLENWNLIYRVLLSASLTKLIHSFTNNQTKSSSLCKESFFGEIWLVRLGFLKQYEINREPINLTSKKRMGI